MLGELKRNRLPARRRGPDGRFDETLVVNDHLEHLCAIADQATDPVADLTVDPMQAASAGMHSRLSAEMAEVYVASLLLETPLTELCDRDALCLAGSAQHTPFGAGDFGSVRLGDLFDALASLRGGIAVERGPAYSAAPNGMGAADVAKAFAADLPANPKLADLADFVMSDRFEAACLAWVRNTSVAFGASAHETDHFIKAFARLRCFDRNRTANCGLPDVSPCRFADLLDGQTIGMQHNQRMLAAVRDELGIDCGVRPVTLVLDQIASRNASACVHAVDDSSAFAMAPRLTDYSLPPLPEGTAQVASGWQVVMIGAAVTWLKALNEGRTEASDEARATAQMALNAVAEGVALAYGGFGMAWRSERDMWLRIGERAAVLSMSRATITNSFVGFDAERISIAQDRNGECVTSVLDGAGMEVDLNAWVARFDGPHPQQLFAPG